MNPRTRWLLSLVSMLVAGSLASPRGWSYEFQVHTRMTSAAFDQAPEFLSNLGIRPEQTFVGFVSRQTARQWIIEGGVSEDSLGRPRFHFYDPISGLGLNGNAVSTVFCGGACTSAPDWAENLNAGDQNSVYSIPATRQSFFSALTTNDPIVRQRQWATTFDAVGRIVHLIQDMAQPQHVRNDIHFTLGPATDFVLTNYSRYERYTDEQAAALTYTGYQFVRLPLWRKFWTETNGKGLAQFTNKNFVSQNTILNDEGQPGFYPNPRFPDTTLSDAVVTNPTNYRGDPILDPNGVPYTNISVRYLSNNYIDAYNPSLSETNPRLAVYSRFDFVHAQQTGQGVLTMDNEVYKSAAAILAPRAVGYSAGLINYFFRGRLEISPPAEGVYALVDHSLAAANTKDTGGFRTIKLKVKNVTPEATGQPGIEPIGAGGSLYAVVKFRRNNCYEPIKLLGQPGAPAYSASCKSTDEEIAVSDPQTAVPADINSASGQAATFLFQSQNVVPINATDVYLQVVYRGPLGEEADAVVAATKDVSEPSFYNFDNYSDCQRNADGTYTTVTGQPLTVNMSFNGGTTYNASITDLAPGKYARFATLADNYFLPVFVQGAGPGFFSTVINQEFGVAGGVTNPTPINKGRPTTVPPASSNDYLYAFAGYGFYPYLNDDGYLGAQGCPTPVDATPQPLNITF